MPSPPLHSLPLPLSREAIRCCCKAITLLLSPSLFTLFFSLCRGLGAIGSPFPSLLPSSIPPQFLHLSLPAFLQALFSLPPPLLTSLHHLTPFRLHPLHPTSILISPPLQLPPALLCLYHHIPVRWNSVAVGLYTFYTVYIYI